MDPYLCCLLQLCCSESEQFAKLVRIRMARGGSESEAEAERAVKFDLEITHGLREILKASRGKP